MTIVIADGRGALWQWDTGRRVKIVGGAGVKQIHYQNNCFDRSVDVDVEDDGTAIIPDELLQDYHRLTAYAYVTDDTGAYTMVQQDFPVYKRAKPADYVFTPVEQTTIAEIAAIAQSVRDDADAGRFDGAQGPAGAGVPDGGTAGQLLSRTESGTEWIDPPQSGVQSDWNQNDATAADYVKNRPGGYIEETIVYSGTLPSQVGIIEQSVEIVEGKKYYVSTNDGEYIEYTAIKEEFSDGTIYYSFGSTTFSEVMNSPSAIDGKFLFLSSIVDGSNMFGGGSGEATGTTYKVRVVDIVKIPQKYLDVNIDTKAAITAFASETDDDALYYYVQNYGSVIFYDDQGYNEKPTQLYDFDKYTVFGAAAPYSYSIRRFMVCQNNLHPVIKILEYDSTNDTQKWKFTDIVYPSILMSSSTIGSAKKFKITVDDSGTISATEVTE